MADRYTASDVAAMLGPDGILSRRIDGFQHRLQQQEMAEAVAQSIDARKLLITEAGTGTGKTFAYVVPAMLCGRKVVISTGTKNLQDQLFHRDLPVVRDVLDVPVSIALLKGRSNYLCIHRLTNSQAEVQLNSRAQVKQLHRIAEWAKRTRSGDRADCSGVPENASIWPLVTSNTDNCLGQECPDYNKCHLAAARRRAQEADLVVINHHLLCADMALKEGGFGELLPDAEVFIIDEAHQLPEVASDFFGLTVSGRQLMELMSDTVTEYHREAGDMADIPRQADVLKKTVQDLRLEFGKEPRRGGWKEIGNNAGVTKALEQVREQMRVFERLLEAVSERGKGLGSVHQRCVDLNLQLTALCEPNVEEDIRWFETQRQSFRLNRTPLEIADVFQQRMQAKHAAWIFTSATLSVGESFEHFENQLGLTGAQTHRWDSPFDYRRQAVWYVPKDMPEPASRDYQQTVSELSLKVIAASRGRAFLLFTSHRALQAAARHLKERVQFPMLVQGDAPKAELLERFRKLGNAVLLGTASFWGGVDVRGSALSCVIIDKLPFAAPGDPVLQARLDAMRQRGANPFLDFQVPQAVIALKQGAGRLIRDVADRGALVLCDPRLLTRPYGKIFIDSMPPMTKTRALSDLERFFNLGNELVDKEERATSAAGVHD